MRCGTRSVSGCSMLYLMCIEAAVTLLRRGMVQLSQQDRGIFSAAVDGVLTFAAGSRKAAIIAHVLPTRGLNLTALSAVPLAAMQLCSAALNRSQNVPVPRDPATS